MKDEIFCPLDMNIKDEPIWEDQAIGDWTRVAAYRYRNTRKDCGA